MRSLTFTIERKTKTSYSNSDFLSIHVKAQYVHSFKRVHMINSYFGISIPS